MKKLSLFSLLGLTGLLAFFAAPIYAQDVEEEINVNENIIAEADDIVAEAEEDVAAIEEGIVAEAEDMAADAEEIVDEVEDVVDDANIIEETNDIVDDAEDAIVTTGMFEMLAGLGIAGWIIGIVLLILVIIALWKAFEKAGEAGWKAIIPIYNIYIMYKIAGMKNWFWYSLIAAFALGILAGILTDYEAILSSISSIFCGIVGIVSMFKFARKYGWGVFASILFVIFTWICILILGFGSSKYQGKEESTVVEA